MAWQLTVGPPGSGRTTRMVAAARKACSEGRRVWWVGLPAQRAYVLHRMTEGGYTALGLEFMSAQQMYYRLLTHANLLKPMLVGSAALVRVGEALMQVSGALPTPGEARLFWRAIAEAKRFGVSASDYRALVADQEQERFGAVYAAYEELKGAWDYDDVRLAAAALVDAPEGLPRTEADLIVVDGLREIGPLELRLFRALAEQADVHLNLTTAPPGEEPTERLTAGYPVRSERYRAPNPVSEARWVMRSLKRDLATGEYQPLDLAVIAPPQRARALSLLAEEYGVPLMDESPFALVDQPLGQRLVDLLEFRGHPTAARLLAVPGLQPLAALALERGVAGVEAVQALADEAGLGEEFRAWLDRLEVGGHVADAAARPEAADPVAWARWLLTEVVGAHEELPRAFAQNALAKAQEAARLGAPGEGFRAWWAALLQDGRTPRREPAGVALLSANAASGRRFRKAYLLGAVDGAYATGEHEDYFLPEEQRLAMNAAFELFALPRRFQGRAEQLTGELLTRADLMIITAPEAGQEGPLVPDASLLGEGAPELPTLGAASPLELERVPAYRAPLGSVDFGRPTVERLRRFFTCPLQVWGEELLRRGSDWEEDLPAWRRLVGALLGGRNSRLAEERLGVIARDFPEAGEWLQEHGEELEGLTFNVELFGDARRPAAQLHAAKRESVPGRAGTHATHATLFRFVAPGAVSTVPEARDYLGGRWTEYYAAHEMMSREALGVDRVDLVVWPVLGAPVSAYPGGFTRNLNEALQRSDRVREVMPLYEAGRVEARPGYHCRHCTVFDLCREGTRQ